jgi:hypothetical protein
MISICIATRKRPGIFKNFCQSVLNTATDPDNIEFVIYKGDDDMSSYEYIGNYKIVVGKNLGFDGGIDECQKVATGPIYGFFPDDLIFETKGWDKMVEDTFTNSLDKILFVYPYDNIAGSKFGSVGFLHKRWIDTVGHFLVPGLVRRSDVWLNVVAKSIGRRHCLKEMRVRNINILTDETHKDYEKIISESENKDKYDSMYRTRYSDIRKLKKVIIRQ